jgi:hypothetical protein
MLRHAAYGDEHQVLVLLGSLKHVEKVVRENDDLLKEVVAIVGDAAAFLEQFLDRRDVLSLEDFGGRGGDQVQDFLRVAVHGLHSDQHATLHVHEPGGDALRDGLLNVRQCSI